MKLSRLQAHMKAAYAYAELSHAERLRVGAVLVRDDRIISVGYNGMPSGGPNDCEVVTGELDGHGRYKEAPQLMTRPEVVHAEMNSIAFAAKNGIATEGSTLVVTDSPCFECCKLLMQSGVKHVVYNREYRQTDGLLFLEDYDITVTRIQL